MGDTNFLQRPEVIAAALLGGSRGRFRSLGPSDFRVQCHGTKPSPPCVPGPPELVMSSTHVASQVHINVCRLHPTSPRTRPKRGSEPTRRGVVPPKSQPSIAFLTSCRHS